MKEYKTINELINNNIVKISKATLTVLGDNGKVKNMINRIETFANMQFNRQMEVNIKIHKLNLQGKIILDRMFKKGNKWYYLNTDDSSKFIMKESQEQHKEKLNIWLDSAIKFGCEILTPIELIDNRR